SIQVYTGSGYSHLFPTRRSSDLESPGLQQVFQVSAGGALLGGQGQVVVDDVRGVAALDVACAGAAGAAWHGSAVEATLALVCGVAGCGSCPGGSETPQALFHVAVGDEVADVSRQTAPGFALVPDVVDQGGRFFGSGAALGDDQRLWWCPPLRPVGRGVGCLSAVSARGRGIEV